MKWNDFLQRKEQYKKTFGELKADYETGPVRQFLNKCYLNVFFNGELIDLGAEISFIALDALSFFIQDHDFKQYLKLLTAYKIEEKRKVVIAKPRPDDDHAPQSDGSSKVFKKIRSQSDRSDESAQQTQDDHKIAALRKLNDFDINTLKVVPNRPELILPTIDMDIIQEIKRSKYCDQDATSMSRASIRIVLIGGDKLGHPWSKF